MTTVPPDSLPPLVASSDAATDLAAAAVRDYCGWHIAPVITQTAPVTARGRALMLPTLRLTDVGAVTDDGNAVTVTDWEECGIALHPSWYWSTGMRAVSVTFTHGFDECPPALAGAVASMAARGVTSLGVTRSQVGQVSRAYAPGATDGALGATEAEMAIIRRYRIPPSS